MDETPFQADLYSEPHIRRCIEYRKKEKHSCVHIGPTGGIAKTLSEQELFLLYAVIFKGGKNPDSTFTLEHFTLSNHTVTSIAYFFGRMGESIAEVNYQQPLFPSFLVTDFSVPIVNAAFHREHIITHLNRR